MYKYSLYYNKTGHSLGIAPISKVKRTLARIPETTEVYKYTDCYYLSSNVEALKKKAEDIKAEWIQDLEKKIQTIKKIKV